VTVSVGEPLIVGGEAAALTVIVKDASEALAVPSLTVITMPEKAPVFVAPGVPESLPFVVLNVAQLGFPAIENVSVPPRGLDAVGVNEYAVPTVAVVAGMPEMVGGVAAVTVMLKVGSEAVEVPSLTEIATPANVPTSVVAGVPVRAPVVALNVAQLGFPVIENVSVPPLGLVAVGVNEYAEPATTEVAGVPLIVGGAETVIENAGSDALAVPSLTEIVMFENVPTSVLAGVPVRAPVVVLNAAQLGLPVIENVSVPFRGLAAVGRNEYACPATTVAAGVPLIVGGPMTVSVKGASCAEAVPSLTEMVTLDVVPVAVGVPVRAPVVVLNAAQAGLLAIENVSAAPRGLVADGVKL
jgi:hypothetical protein